MKTFLIILLGSLLQVGAAHAQASQGNSGLYRTAADFRQRRLTLPGNCKTDGHRLRLHEFLSRPYLTVVHHGQEYRVAKDTLFGFRDCDGREFRFTTDKQYYPILNPKEEILLYKVEQATVGKNPGYVRRYFSASAEAPVLPLTIQNVKNAFPDNRKFQELLDAQCKQESDMMAFDTGHGMTMVNWLLKRSREPGAGR